MSVAFQFITITIVAVATLLLLLDVKIAAAFTTISTTHHRRRQQLKIIMSSHQTSPTDANASSSPRAAIDFLTLTRSLKTTKRTGWVMSGVQNPESIADHMYRMSLMAMIASFSNESLDTNRCIKLALIHDLAEAKVGDITPHCGVSDEEKYKLELGTMEQIQSMLGPMLGGDEILDLWKEYEEGSTTEAKLLKDLDKIEMILQAQEYEAEGSSEKSLDQFFTSTEGKWRTEIGRAWAEEIVSRRKKSEDK
jgi:putative hydrolase of HD superfamily